MNDIGLDKIKCWSMDLLVRVYNNKISLLIYFGVLREFLITTIKMQYMQMQIVNYVGSV